MSQDVANTADRDQVCHELAQPILRDMVSRTEMFEACQKSWDAALKYIQYGYCVVCGSCGEDGCCAAERCAYPGIKAETLKSAKEIAEEVCQENVKLKKEVEHLKGEYRALESRHRLED